MSTSTLGGHVNTIPEQADGGRRRRRLHSDQFKANAVASCMQAGMSMAAVAMANGVNANLLRRWVRAAETRPGTELAHALPAFNRRVAEPPAAFIPMQLPAKTSAADIRVELRRGATSLSVAWLTEAATECAAWMPASCCGDPHRRDVARRGSGRHACLRQRQLRRERGSGCLCLAGKHAPRRPTSPVELNSWSVTVRASPTSTFSVASD